MPHTIVFDKTKCIGASNCVAIAPDTWELDSEGLAHNKISSVSDDVLERNIQAARACPTKAIDVIDKTKKSVI